MIKISVPVLMLFLFTNATAQIIPLTCGDYVVLTETATNLRDKAVPFKSALNHLGSDEFMNSKDRKIVRNMITRVYKKSDKSEAEHKAISRNECGSKLIKR